MCTRARGVESEKSGLEYSNLDSGSVGSGLGYIGLSCIGWDGLDRLDLGCIVLAEIGACRLGHTGGKMSQSGWLGGGEEVMLGCCVLFFGWE